VGVATDERPSTARAAPRSHVDLWLVPTMNPDGDAAGQRGKGNLADLNRNWPNKWMYITGNPSDKFDSHHSGPAALSESETRAMQAFLIKVHPNWVVSMHQPLDGVDTTDGGGEGCGVPRCAGSESEPAREGAHLLRRLSREHDRLADELHENRCHHNGVRIFAVVVAALYRRRLDSVESAGRVVQMRVAALIRWSCGESNPGCDKRRRWSEPPHRLSCGDAPRQITSNQVVVGELRQDVGTPDQASRWGRIWLPAQHRTLDRHGARCVIRESDLGKRAAALLASTRTVC
jgi:hypothetical protein